MWGYANYFAVKASYSDSYHHKTKDGKKQMFCARVVIGNCVECEPDSSMKFPPPHANPADQYDSVKGYTGGSDVYMMYTNKQAYPEYLITYSD